MRSVQQRKQPFAFINTSEKGFVFFIQSSLFKLENPFKCVLSAGKGSSDEIVWHCLGYQCCAWSHPQLEMVNTEHGVGAAGFALCPLELGFHGRADAHLLWVHGQNCGKWDLMTSGQPRPAEAFG